MVRQLSVVLGVGLVILWLAELTANVAPWLTWLDLVAGASAFLIAGAVNNRSSQSIRVGSPIALALGLFALWIISLAASSAPAWQSWWNFGFACAFVLTGLGATIPGSRYRGRLGAYHYGPYSTYSSGAFGAGYPYTWEPYVPMGGYDFSQKAPGHSGRGPRTYRRSDLRIEEDVNDRLTAHWEVDASDIVVQVKDQVVVLQGRVESRRAKRIAEDIAESVPGVKDVKNELQVKGKDTTSSVRAA